MATERNPFFFLRKAENCLNRRNGIFATGFNDLAKKLLSDYLKIHFPAPESKKKYKNKSPKQSSKAIGLSNSVISGVKYPVLVFASAAKFAIAQFGIRGGGGCTPLSLTSGEREDALSISLTRKRPTGNLIIRRQKRSCNASNGPPQSNRTLPVSAAFMPSYRAGFRRGWPTRSTRRMTRKGRKKERRRRRRRPRTPATKRRSPSTWTARRSRWRRRCPGRRGTRKSSSCWRSSGSPWTSATSGGSRTFACRTEEVSPRDFDRFSRFVWNQQVFFSFFLFFFFFLLDPPGGVNWINKEKLTVSWWREKSILPQDCFQTLLPGNWVNNLPNVTK